MGGSSCEDQGQASCRDQRRRLVEDHCVGGDDAGNEGCWYDLI